MRQAVHVKSTGQWHIDCEFRIAKNKER